MLMIPSPIPSSADHYEVFTLRRWRFYPTIGIFCIDETCYVLQIINVLYFVLENI